MQQLKSAISGNKYHPKGTVHEENRHLDFLINPGFQGVNRLFVLSFKNNGGRRVTRDITFH